MTTRISRRAVLAGSAAAFAASVAREPSRAATMTSPADGGFNFQVVGDWGEAESRYIRTVARQMEGAATRDRPRFVISVGDNFYDDGVTNVSDPLWKEAFEDIFSGPGLDCSWYPVLGNHDHRGSVTAEIDYGTIDPRWRMSASFYSRTEPVGNGENAEFFFIDTNPIARSWAAERLLGIGAFEAQLEWLEAGLEASRSRWKIVAGHHPVFSGGRHGGTPPLQDTVRPLLERYGVAVYLAGHNHCLEDVAVGNVRYLTSGAAAKTSPVHTIQGTRFAAAGPGFLTADLSADALSYRFIGADGATLHADRIPPPIR